MITKKQFEEWKKSVQGKLYAANVERVLLGRCGVLLDIAEDVVHLNALALVELGKVSQLVNGYKLPEVKRLDFEAGLMGELEGIFKGVLKVAQDETLCHSIVNLHENALALLRAQARLQLDILSGLTKPRRINLDGKEPS